VGTVLAKEAADYLSGARMWLLEALVFLTAIAAAYAAILSIRANIGESPFLFLRLLTMAQDPLPSFIALLGFLIPLVAIAIGFDAINGEFSRRTLSRVLAQPIYRDALLLWSVVAPLVATLIAGPPEGIFGPSVAYLQTALAVDRISPNTLYAEIALALLQPATRALGPVLYSQVQRALLGAPLPATQSFILVWPQLTGLVAAMILIFAVAYIVFQRQEIRA
jgi:ABC-2 type transport system permease protein